MDANSKHVSNSTFELERIFAAPLERVWTAWSEREQLGKWWGPKGCSVEIASLDFRPGGFFHYSMRFDNAPVSWGRFNYREVVPHRKIVWLNSFANEKGGIVRAPFSDLCPMEIQNSVAFTEHEGRTSVMLVATPFGANAGEIQYFATLCSSGSLAQGYGGTLDGLAQHLDQFCGQR